MAAVGAFTMGAIEVHQLDAAGNVIATFASVYHAARALGKTGGQGNINSVANGKAKTAYGFRWRYGDRPAAAPKDPPAPKKRAAAPTVFDLAYIAGMFDGDGSVNISLVGPQGKKG